MAFNYYVYSCLKCGETTRHLSTPRNSCPRCGQRGDEYTAQWWCSCGYTGIFEGKSCPYCGSTEYEARNNPNDPTRQRNSSSGGCFLTTVVCQVLSYEDDCFALENLRKFRSEVLEKIDRGKKLLAEYRKVSDLIIPNIESDEEKENVCRYVYDNYIMPVNRLVEESKNDAAIDKYTEMVNYFIGKYNIQWSE